MNSVFTLSYITSLISIVSILNYWYQHWNSASDIDANFNNKEFILCTCRSWQDTCWCSLSVLGVLWKSHLFAFIRCGAVSWSTAMSAADGLITPWSEPEIFDCLGKIWKLHVFYLLWEVHILNRWHSPGGCSRNASLQSDKRYHKDSYNHENN